VYAVHNTVMSRLCCEVFHVNTMPKYVVLKYTFIKTIFEIQLKVSFISRSSLHNY